MAKNIMYDSEGEAEEAANQEIAGARARIMFLSNALKSLPKGDRRQRPLIDELRDFLKYSKHYEYFCVSDEGNDSSAYIDIFASDEKSVEWGTLGGVVYRIKGNPIPRLAKQALEKIIGGEEDVRR